MTIPVILAQQIKNLPFDGEKGQILTKASNEQFEIEWTDIPTAFIGPMSQEEYDNLTEKKPNVLYCIEEE